MADSQPSTNQDSNNQPNPATAVVDQASAIEKIVQAAVDGAVTQIKTEIQAATSNIVPEITSSYEQNKAAIEAASARKPWVVISISALIGLVVGIVATLIVIHH